MTDALPQTGDGAIDAVLAPLADVGDSPLEEQYARLRSAQEALARALDAATSDDAA